jgi:hypothetical protein
MPAPSKFKFTSGGYAAELSGVITSELAISLIGRTRIRAYGFLNFNDNAGNTYLVTNAPISSGSSLLVGGGDQKIVLIAGDKIYVQSSASTSADAVMSIMEIT